MRYCGFIETCNRVTESYDVQDEYVAAYEGVTVDGDDREQVDAHEHTVQHHIAPNASP